MAEKVDVVYPLGNGSKWANGELRYSLRALERNFLDLGRVFVVGFRPRWITGITHIPFDDVSGRNKDANLIDKLLMAVANGASERFIRSSDDEMILRPLHADDMLPFHCGDLKSKPAKFWEGGWKERLRHTMLALQERGLPTIHYDSHIPKIYDRELFKRVTTTFPYRRNPGFTIDTLVLNHANVTAPSVNGMKLTLERPINNADEIRKQLAGKQYLGYNDSGLTKELKQVLFEMFPEPSRFEKLAGDAPNAAASEWPVVVAVLGSGRSGSSCLAGMLHLLGVSMGERFQNADAANPRGYYEALGLKRIINAQVDSLERVLRLRTWMKNRAKLSPEIFGAKFYPMCKMVPELAQAWPNMRVIAIDRPIAEIVQSQETAKYTRGLAADERAALASKLVAKRDEDVTRLNLPVLRLTFTDLIKDTEAVINRIVDFLDIEPSPEQRAAALAFVDPTLRHHGG